jgi:KH domain-containing protein
MIKLICDKLPRITKNRARLEKELNVKITNRGKEVFIDGEPEDEYVAEKVIDALNFGFPFSTAMLIDGEDFVFEAISIKDHTKKQNFPRIRARIIGAKGKTIRTLTELTKCHFEIKDNVVGVIGPPEYLYNANQAIISLIKGTKQSNVYAYLEKHQIKPVVDLGLRDVEK